MRKSLEAVVALLVLAVLSAPSAAQNGGASERKEPAVRLGDMLLRAGQVVLAGEADGADRLRPMGHVKRGIRSWPDGVLPIEYAQDVTPEHRGLFEDACRLWSGADILCVPRHPDDDVYVKVKYGNGCSSWVGYPLEGLGGFIPPWDRERPITLQDDADGTCWTEAVIAHEIGHALGLLHELMRPDRDAYIRVVWRNIDARRLGQFMRVSGHTFGTEYDFDSLMHYSNRDFRSWSARTREDLRTFVARRPEYEDGVERAGQATAPSPLDLETVKAFYGVGASAGIAAGYSLDRRMARGR